MKQVAYVTIRIEGSTEKAVRKEIANIPKCPSPNNMVATKVTVVERASEAPTTESMQRYCDDNGGAEKWDTGEFVMYADAMRLLDAKQAKIDALMLEWCPDEMSKEQMNTWAMHQKKVTL